MNGATTWRATVAMSLVLATILAGCTKAPDSVTTPAEATPSMIRPIVVAVIDSGINPYHEWFRASTVDFDPGGFLRDGDESPTTVQLTLGDDYQESRSDDESFWQTAERRHLYSFKGTRVLGISFADDSLDSIAVLDELNHGTYTSGAVAKATSNDVIIVMVEHAYACTAPPPQGPLSCPSTAAEGVRWAAEQPWIDVISMSFGVLFAAPPMLMEEPARPFIEATQAAAAAGKILVAAAGNYPVPNQIGATAGPPWVIAVGGSMPEYRGDRSVAARLPEIVSNYTMDLPRYDSVHDTFSPSGTSFSAPNVAGTIASALEQVRKAGVTTTAEELRDALHQSAHYWQVGDYVVPSIDPLQPGPTVNELLTIPVIGPPCIQMGWGHVDPGHVQRIANHILATERLPPKEEATAACIAALSAIREAYWTG